MMARIRSIKPEFWTSEQVVECSPIARLLFIGMWNFCDDGGNHPASFKTLKMEVFPGDDITLSQIETYTLELLKHNLLVQYDGGNGRKYWHVTGWHHQKIDKPNPKHPPFVMEKFDDHSTNHRIPIDDHSPQEGKGREGKGKELKTIDRNSDEFDRFWIAYPKKTGKLEAAKAWNKKKPDIQIVLQTLEWQTKSRQWKEGYIPNPATYLNQGRWQDSPSKERPSKLDNLHEINKRAVDGWMPPEMRNVR
jgi:hypothetical protein